MISFLRVSRAEEHQLAAFPAPERLAALDKTPASVSTGLGTAYEKGLAYEQVIDFSEQAAADAAQKVRATSQITLCPCAIGRHEEAACTFGTLLEGRRGTELQLRNISYFLGRALMSLCRPLEALAHYQILQAQESGFRDVESRVRRLSSARSFFSFSRSFDPTVWVRMVARNCTQLLRSSS